MEYDKIYNSLIERAKLRDLKKLNKHDPNYIYLEEHHIIPKCLNGTDDKNNIVTLTAREHYIAHALLFKHYKQCKNKNAYIKMAYAISRLMHGNLQFITKLNVKFNSHLYEAIVKQKVLSEEAKQKIGNANRGRIPSKETRKKLSEASKRYCREHINGFYGKHHTLETKKKISRPGKLSAWYGRHHTDKTKEKLSLSRKNNPKCRGSHIGRKPGFHFTLAAKIKQFYNVHAKKYPNIDWSKFDFVQYFNIINSIIHIQKRLRKQFILNYINSNNIS